VHQELACKLASVLQAAILNAWGANRFLFKGIARSIVFVGWGTFISVVTSVIAGRIGRFGQ
jgi:hypothetical protein